jgi:hypothetical protein
MAAATLRPSVCGATWTPARAKRVHCLSMGHVLDVLVSERFDDQRVA